MTPRCTHIPKGDAARQAAAVAATVPVLETERLRLRPPTLADLPPWTSLLESDEKGHLGGPFDAEAAFESFCVYVAGWMLHGHGLWSVEDHAGTLLGFVHLGLEWEDDAPEIGWLFLPEHRGKGVATEAASAVRDHALRLLGPGQAVSYVASDNHASNRLAVRLGATRESGAPYGPEVILWRHGGSA